MLAVPGVADDLVHRAVENLAQQSADEEIVIDDHDTRHDAASSARVLLTSILNLCGSTGVVGSRPARGGVRPHLARPSSGAAGGAGGGGGAIASRPARHHPQRVAAERLALGSALVDEGDERRLGGRYGQAGRCRSSSARRPPEW